MGDDMDNSNAGYADPFAGGKTLPGETATEEELALSILSGGDS